MAAAARQARATALAPRYEEEARPTSAYRAPHTRRKAAQRSRLMRTFVIFVACLTLLAVGRVALSFAVVQKSLQTDAIVRQERRVTALNDRREEKVANLASTPRIRHIATAQLGLVDPTDCVYVTLDQHGKVIEVAATR